MALVRVSQEFVMEGYAEIEKKAHWWSRPEYVREQIAVRIWVVAICDENEAPTVIEEKIKKQMKTTRGWGRNFEGWVSYRKYCKPGEVLEYPNGKEWKLYINYIRNWKMEDIIKTLDGNQFAVLCKELGIGASEAIARV